MAARVCAGCGVGGGVDGDVSEGLKTGGVEVMKVAQCLAQKMASSGARLSFVEHSWFVFFFLIRGVGFLMFICGGYVFLGLSNFVFCLGGAFES